MSINISNINLLNKMSQQLYIHSHTNIYTCKYFVYLFSWYLQIGNVNGAMTVECQQILFPK